MPNRIAEIRKNAGLTQEQLAERIGSGRSQVVKLERGERRLSETWLRRLAKALKCSPGELLGGEGNVAVVGFIGAGERIIFVDDHAQGAGLEYVERPPDFQDGVALIVRGNSMAPRYFDGDVVYYNETFATRPTDLLGRDCVVRLVDGTTLLKRIESGNGTSAVALRSYNPSEPIMYGPKIEWACPVAWVKPR